MIPQNLVGHSLAGYSTWFLFKPNDCLFDCGEGCAAELRNGVFGVSRIFLSHSHWDHVSGLLSFVYARGMGTGDKTKTLTVHYPAGDGEMERIKQFVVSSSMNREFSIRWVPVQPGDVFTLGGKREVRVHATRHDLDRLTVGYSVWERREKLKPEFTSRPPAEIAMMIMDSGRDGMIETVKAPILFYSGDTVVEDHGESMAGAVMMHECTFLSEAEVKRDIHSVLRPVLELVNRHKPKEVVLYHFSGRYDEKMVDEAVKTACREIGVESKVWAWFGRERWDVWSPGGATEVLPPFVGL